MLSFICILSVSLSLSWPRGVALPSRLSVSPFPRGALVSNAAWPAIPSSRFATQQPRKNFITSQWLTSFISLSLFPPLTFAPSALLPYYLSLFPSPRLCQKRFLTLAVLLIRLSLSLSLSLFSISFPQFIFAKNAPGAITPPCLTRVSSSLRVSAATCRLMTSQNGCAPSGTGCSNSGPKLNVT